MGVVKLLRASDAAFTNLEVSFLSSNPMAYPAPMPRGQWHPTDPSLLKQLQWMGFNLFGAANNHAGDYGVAGMLDEIRLLKRDGAVYAGLGANLALARSPGYLTTPHGTVGLVTSTSTFPADSAAQPSRPDVEGRPGVNPLHHEEIYRVNAATFDALRNMKKELYLGSSKGDTASKLTLHLPPSGFPNWAVAVRVELSDKPGVFSVADPKDLAAITSYIREARSFSDYVVASFHSHEGALGPDPLETPDQFVVQYAHAAVNAGADIVVGSGPHVLRPIEIYKGKVIFYSLGNFIFENWLYVPEPEDYYQLYGLGWNALNSQVYATRKKVDPMHEVSNPIYWRTVVARVIFHDGRPALVKLYPVTTGFEVGKNLSDRGVPEMADQATATEILEHLAKISAPYGTKIAIANGIGTITIPQ